MQTQSITQSLNACAGTLHNKAAKLLNKPIAAAMSLMLVAAITATIASRSEESAPTPASTPTQAAVEPKTFPMEYTITDTQGRKMDVVLTGKTQTTVKFTRKTDNKEFEMPLAKISEDDQKFVAALKQPVPVPFDGHIANYGGYFLIRFKGGTYGISIQGIPSIKSVTPNDPCFYAIKYKIFGITDDGTAKLIAEKTSDERDEKEKYHVIKCNRFEFEWSARGANNCYVHFKDKTMKSFNGAPIQGAPQRPDGLPSGAEYYSQHLSSLEEFSQLDPTRWETIPAK